MIKRKIKPLIIAFTIILIAIVSYILLIQKITVDTKARLTNLGYNNKEIKLIINNIKPRNYKLIKKYDKSIINLITAQNFNSKKFDKYYKYYEQNKKTNINDIIAIINKGDELMNYPASKLLASLVKEKYFINKNTARYLDYGNNKQIPSKEIISLVNANADYPQYTHTKEANISDNNLIIVNKYYSLKENYEPNDLIELNNKYNKGNNNKLRKEAAEAFMKMADAAMLDNIIIQNASGYRSYNYQVSLYKSYEEKEGKENADLFSARPGHSEHQTGLCTDINIIDSSFDETPEAKWLTNNSYKYGFILRYPKDKEQITGYRYESWHYRYVGEEAAKIIYQENITFDEYYEFYINNK